MQKILLLIQIYTYHICLSAAHQFSEKDLQETLEKGTLFISCALYLECKASHIQLEVDWINVAQKIFRALEMCQLLVVFLAQEQLLSVIKMGFQPSSKTNTNIRLRQVVNRKISSQFPID